MAVTYYQRNIASDIAGDNELLKAAGVQATHAITVAKGATNAVFATYVTDANDPSLLSWGTGNVTANIVLTAGTGVTYVTIGVRISRISADGATVRATATSAFVSAQTSGTKTPTAFSMANLTQPTGAAVTDRFLVELLYTNSRNTAYSFTFADNDTSASIAAPWTPVFVFAATGSGTAAVSGDCAAAVAQKYSGDGTVTVSGDAALNYAFTSSGTATASGDVQIVGTAVWALAGVAGEVAASGAADKNVELPFFSFPFEASGTVSTSSQADANFGYTESGGGTASFTATSATLAWTADYALASQSENITASGAVTVFSTANYAFTAVAGESAVSGAADASYEPIFAFEGNPAPAVSISGVADVGCIPIFAFEANPYQEQELFVDDFNRAEIGSTWQGLFDTPSLVIVDGHAATTASDDFTFVPYALTEGMQFVEAQYISGRWFELQCHVADGEPSIQYLSIWYGYGLPDLGEYKYLCLTSRNQDRTQIDVPTGVPISPGDIIRLEQRGNRFLGFLNGVYVGAIEWDGEGGYPGFAFAAESNGQPSCFIDNFRAGNLVGVLNASGAAVEQSEYPDEYPEVGAGTATFSNSADVTVTAIYGMAGDGELLASGDAVSSSTASYPNTGSGTAVIESGAVSSFGYVLAGSGDVNFSAAAEHAETAIYGFTGSGTVSAAGDATQQFGYVFSGQGQANASASADPNFGYAFAGDGTAQSSGELVAQFEYLLSGDGTAILSGAATLASGGNYEFVGTGTADFSGEAQFSLDSIQSGTGTAALSGIAGLKFGYSFSTTGTVTSAGDAVTASTSRYAFTGEGESAVSGTSDFAFGYIFAGSGTATTSGQGSLGATGEYSITSKGEANFTGDAAWTLDAIYAGSGDVATDGTAGFIFGYAFSSSGTVAAAGDASLGAEIVFSFVGEGDVTSNGEAVLAWQPSYASTGTGEFLASGNAAWTAGYNFAAVGQALTEGASTAQFGFVLAGAGTATFSGSSQSAQAFEIESSGTLLASGVCGYTVGRTYSGAGTGVLAGAGACAWTAIYPAVSSGTVRGFGSVDELFDLIFAGLGEATLSGAAAIQRTWGAQTIAVLDGKVLRLIECTGGSVITVIKSQSGVIKNCLQILPVVLGVCGDEGTAPAIAVKDGRIVPAIESDGGKVIH